MTFDVGEIILKINYFISLDDYTFNQILYTYFFFDQISEVVMTNDYY